MNPNKKRKNISIESERERDFFGGNKQDIKHL